MDDPHAACTDLLTDSATFHQHDAGFLEQVALHYIDIGAAFHRFRTRLNDVQLAVVAVFGPLDVHRTTVVLLDDHRLLGQLADLGIAEAEARAIGAFHIDNLDRFTGLGFVAVNHLDGFAAQVAAQDRRAAGFQRLFVDIELIRVNRTLYHGFTQAVGAGDKHRITEARLGVQGEHHAGGPGFRTHHSFRTPRIFRKVSCWPAKEAPGRSSAGAEERTATAIFSLPPAISAKAVRICVFSSSGKEASITHWRICAPVLARRSEE